jgi:hypothetical protein
VSMRLWTPERGKRFKPNTETIQHKNVWLYSGI